MKFWCRLGWHKWSKSIRTGKYGMERACRRCGISETSIFYDKDELVVDTIVLLIYKGAELLTGVSMDKYIQDHNLMQEIKWAEGKRKIESIIQEAKR